MKAIFSLITSVFFVSAAEIQRCNTGSSTNIKTIFKTKIATITVEAPFYVTEIETIKRNFDLTKTEIEWIYRTTTSVYSSTERMTYPFVSNIEKSVKNYYWVTEIIFAGLKDTSTTTEYISVETSTSTRVEYHISKLMKTSTTTVVNSDYRTVFVNL
eukprot:GHVN01088508.1.p1 GENE.GHVN01088508.1~~GHVN01088508.1.p1  ORF type:complete len:157 (-),score=17.03 GHVN01088508.1:288-758(-)